MVNLKMSHLNLLLSLPSSCFAVRPSQSTQEDRIRCIYLKLHLLDLQALQFCCQSRLLILLTRSLREDDEIIRAVPEAARVPKGGLLSMHDHTWR